MSNRTLRIATRKSQLALWQAEYVRDLLLVSHPGLRIELLPLSTQGDRILDVPLAKLGGKGLFVKELEIALLDGRADLAVHSMKDVPMDLPAGLRLDTIMSREDPRDAFVSSSHASFAALPAGARVGTSSLRRQCQLRAERSDLRFVDLRGNVNTRLAKLDAGDFEAIVLAAAGLMRLGMTGRISSHMAPELSLPAAGQGAVGVEIRAGDDELHALLAPLHDAESADRVRAERAMNRELQGGCQVPIAGYAEIDSQTGMLWLRGLVGSIDGARVIRGETRGPREQAEEIGRTLARDLLARGAREILDAI